MSRCWVRYDEYVVGCCYLRLLKQAREVPHALLKQAPAAAQQQQCCFGAAAPGRVSSAPLPGLCRDTRELAVGPTYLLALLPRGLEKMRTGLAESD
jgi:hypothetical protein